MNKNDYPNFITGGGIDDFEVEVGHSDITKSWNWVHIWPKSENRYNQKLKLGTYLAKMRKQNDMYSIQNTKIII